MNEGMQRAQLTSMRQKATGLLALMALLLAVLHWAGSTHPLSGYATAFAEAALVGGLADWFAVTALFRHPFGIPLPHTAILPASQQRLADSIAEFVEHNFLEAEVIAQELARIDVAVLAVRWLSRPARRRWVARQVIRAGGQLPPGPLLATLLEVMLARRWHEPVFDQLIGQMADFLDEHQAEIYKKVSDKSSRWMPRRFNDEFFLRLMEGLAELLVELRAPGSEARQRFAQSLNELALWLRTPEGAEQAREMAGPLLAGRDLSMPLQQALASLARQLTQDQRMQATLNQQARALLTALALSQRRQIAGLARRVVLSWDTETLVRRLEHPVGRDLQFIRINGTLVGGLVGVCLHGLRDVVN